ncbi:MAG TPA: hypothetical protein PLD01_05560 [Mycobacterium sp.]|nr:hypothetical protein [Mycobacterium sp.]
MTAGVGVRPISVVRRGMWRPVGVGLGVGRVGALAVALGIGAAVA